jgi:hypothetical protein
LVPPLHASRLGRHEKRQDLATEAKASQLLTISDGSDGTVWNLLKKVMNKPDETGGVNLCIAASRLSGRPRD